METDKCEKQHWWQAEGKLSVREDPEASAEAIADFLPGDIVLGLDSIPSQEWLQVDLAGAIRFASAGTSEDCDGSASERHVLSGFVRVRNRFRELLTRHSDVEAASEQWAKQVSERQGDMCWFRPPPRSAVTAAQYERPLLRGGIEEFERRWEVQAVANEIVAAQPSLRTYSPQQLQADLRQRLHGNPWLEPLLAQKTVVVSLLSTAISQLKPVVQEDRPNPLHSSSSAQKAMPEEATVATTQEHAVQGQDPPSSAPEASARVQLVPTPVRALPSGSSVTISLCTDSSHFTELLARIPWQDYNAFASTSRLIANAVVHADWRRLCDVLAEEHGLLLPRLQHGHVSAPACAKEWRLHFHELWLARAKWNAVPAQRGFRVRTLARLRPGKFGSDGPSKIFLPLHQRLQLVKLGLDSNFQQEVAERMRISQESESLTASSEQDGESTESQDVSRFHARVVSTEDARVLVSLPGMGLRYFEFEQVFDGRHGQADVYSVASLPAVEAFLRGFSACVLCYGQTGSGKTHTMFGRLDEWQELQGGSLKKGGPEMINLGPHAGMAPRALADILGAVEARRRSVSCTVQLSYIEIYQDKLTDLLSGNDIALFRIGEGVAAEEYREVAELGPDELYHLQGAEVNEVQNVAEALRMLAKGEERKHRAATALNARSSRAHSVLMLSLTQRFQGFVLRSRLHLVDLGGSEQVKKSRAEGARFSEAVEINSSLMVLGRVVDALVNARSHVPYYESKLTMLLQPALGGHAQTTVLVTASPEDEHAFRFGERCAHLTNKAQASTAPMSEVLASLDAGIAACKQELKELQAKGAEGRALAELGDGQLRGLGFGHDRSRLIAQSHDDGTSGQDAALPAMGSYTLVEDIAGHWIACQERMVTLQQRRSEILGL